MPRITEVRIKLMDETNERLRAFASITFDDAFVIRDLKVIECTGGFFVAMPSRKITDACPHCGCKNHLRARFCNQCGGKLKEDRTSLDSDGRKKLYADTAHPINEVYRAVIERAVLSAYRREKELAKQPGYACAYHDEYIKAPHVNVPGDQLNTFGAGIID